MSYRKINQAEIKTLEKQGCRAETWDLVEVTDDFLPARVMNTHFAGTVKLGKFDGIVEIEAGISRPAGLNNCYLQNVTVGNRVYLANIKNLVNYDIQDNVVIENVNTILVTGKTRFGNGTKIELLNEGGGRELPIFDQLSSQIAYLIVNYRHDQVLQEKLQAMLENYIAAQESDRGTIGQKAKIINSGVLRNVKIGAHAIVSGAVQLVEGTIGSCEEAPAIVGEGVIANDFIILSGSKVDGCAMLADCFVGQAVKIGKQYSAENSAFFANAEGFHGEACSIFAGPYTVTHHKSTLLIAGLFSFFNAGSGTNQSNHMYKLGPLHQGILERGSKTGSFSYLLWPSRVGAFTAVIGKHSSNFDTADLPFSYITDEGGKSVLTPAMNLFTVGTRRDSAKWLARDKRKDPNKLDLINFDLFSPYTIGKAVRGQAALKALYARASREQEYVLFNGISIKRLMLKTCSKYYEIAIKIFIGNELVQRLEGITGPVSLDSLKDALKPETVDAKGNWVDIAGLLAPASAIEKLQKSIREDEITTLDALTSQLKVIFENYAAASWRWCVDLMEQRLGVSPAEMTVQQLIQVINDWQKNSVKLNNMIQQDAEKEFDANSRIGFGIDGDEAVRAKDFEAVRGTFDSNKFVKELKQESETIQQRAGALVVILEKLV